MESFNSYINGGDVKLKSFPGCRVTQSEHHTIPILEEQQYDAAEICVGINDLLPNNLTTKSMDEISNDIINIANRCCSQIVATIFISSIAYNARVNFQLICNINGLL